MKSKLTILAVAFLSITACKNDPPATKTAPVAPPAEASMGIASSKWNKTEGNCDKACAQINVSYPEVKGGNSDFQIAVSEWVLAWVRDNISTESKSDARKTFDQSGEDFIKMWQEDSKSNPDFQRSYVFENKDTILCELPKVVSLRMDAYTDVGGAHPNYATTFANFDPNTGGPIFVNKVIKDEAAVMKMVEPKYIALKKSEGGASFNPDFKAGKMPFPKNWAYTPNGLLFHYNTYEIAPHAVGDADIFISWEDLGAAATKL